MTSKEEYQVVEKESIPESPPGYEELKTMLQYTPIPIAETQTQTYEVYLEPFRKHLRDISAHYDGLKFRRRLAAHAAIKEIIQKMEEDCKQLDRECHQAMRQQMRSPGSFTSWLQSLWG